MDVKEIYELRRKNLAELVKRYGVRLVAKRFGKPDRQINDILSGRKPMGERITDSMESNYAPALPRGWLSSQNFVNPDQDDFKGQGLAQVIDLNRDFFKNDVPLIGLHDAVQWEKICMKAKEVAEEWLCCPVPHSEQTFAIRISGWSMIDPGQDVEHSFNENDIVFIDPGREPGNRDFVLAQVGGDVLFRRLLVDGTKRFLYALNPLWTPRIAELGKFDRILGVAAFVGKKL